MGTQLHCDQCGKDMPGGSVLGSRFCSDSCKVDYFNGSRKVERAKKRIEDAVAILSEFFTDDTVALSKEALDALVATRVAIHNAELDLSWKCIECGQFSMFDVALNEYFKCDFCGANHWCVTKINHIESES